MTTHDKKFEADEARRTAQHEDVKGEVRGDVQEEIEAEARAETPRDALRAKEVARALKTEAVQEIVSNPKLRPIV